MPLFSFIRFRRRAARPVLILAALILALCPAVSAADAFPEALTFTQTTADRVYLRDRVYRTVTYPDTCSDQVDGEMRALIDAMADAAMVHLPAGTGDKMENFLDAGAQIFRTGTKWMSFLTVASIAWEQEQTYVDMDARVYDMETGQRVFLTDLFAPGSPAWDLIHFRAAEGLAAYWPDETPDPEKLDELVSLSSLENAAFTLSPGRLTLHWMADALYPGKTTLMHVSIPYGELRFGMTEEALVQTDNSAHPIAALTFDDGPNGGYSINVISLLRKYGAQGTFFMVGSNMYNGKYVVARQHDALHDPESHNWVHVYEDLTPANVLGWKSRFDTLMTSIIGKGASYMRGPGGYWRNYAAAGVGLPLVDWSVTSTDAGSDNIGRICGIVRSQLKDGSVVLMHDLNRHCCEYLEQILQFMEANGYYCVTVAEMFEMFSSPLQANQIHYSCEDLTR